VGRAGIPRKREPSPAARSKKGTSGPRKTKTYAQVLASVKVKYRALLKSSKHPVSNMPLSLAVSGIYILSDDSGPLYIGRSDNVRRRLQWHTHNSHSQATLAFLMARRSTGNVEPSCRTTLSRAALLKSDRSFRRAFDRARKDIRAMRVQHVRVEDAATQAVLEVATALLLKTPFNDFGNH
jgi:hypothetical protein